MTHQNHLTNGASLEDCHTNFFALVSYTNYSIKNGINRDREAYYNTHTYTRAIHSNINAY